jgi:hypothetical protein
MLDAFIGRTIRPFLVVFGLLTGVTVLFALDIDLFGPMFRDLVDYTPASVPALRHWGIMVFGVGMLMVAAAFRAPLRDDRLRRSRKGVPPLSLRPRRRRALGHGLRRPGGDRHHHRRLLHPLFPEPPRPPAALDPGAGLTAASRAADHER